MSLYLSTSVSQVRSSNFSGPSKIILISLSRVLGLKQSRCFVARRPRTEKPLFILVVLGVMRSENLNNIINSGYSDRSFIRVSYISDGAVGWSSLYCAALPDWSFLFSINCQISSFLLSSRRTSTLKLKKNDQILSWLNSNLSIIGSAVFVSLLKVYDFGSP